MTFKQGPIDIKSYKATIKSSIFKRLEKISNKFLKENSKYLGKYMDYCNDPLHNWSRQYEYPFVYKQIKDYFQNLSIKKNNKIKVLDAGSGITFFPYLLQKEFDKFNVTCVDYDQSLIQIFKDINKKFANKPKFKYSDISNLPFNDESFDVVYCISVLEHTKNYDKIIEEYYRILKKGGLLIITFDISLDQRSDIIKEKAVELVRLLKKCFKDNRKDDSMDILNIKRNDKYLTTDIIKRDNPSLLPWRVSLLSVSSKLYRSLLSFKMPRKIITPDFFSLAFYCISLKKK